MRRITIPALLMVAGALLAAGPDADPKAPPPHPGKAVWEKHCQKCHGTDGKGNAKLAATLKIEAKLLDLTRPETLARPEAELFKAVEEGRIKMPGFRKDNKLSCYETAQVIGYMHTLQPKPAQEKKP